MGADWILWNIQHELGGDVRGGYQGGGGLSESESESTDEYC